MHVCYAYQYLIINSISFILFFQSTNPGIGVPAVAASGAMAANAIIPLGKHLDLLRKIRMPEKVVNI
jgi:hypothetical protein